MRFLEVEVGDDDARAVGDEAEKTWAMGLDGDAAYAARRDEGDARGITCDIGLGMRCSLASSKRQVPQMRKLSDVADGRVGDLNRLGAPRHDDLIALR